MNTREQNRPYESESHSAFAKKHLDNAGLDKSNVEALNIMGRIALDSHQLSTAKRHFNQALEINQNDATTVINLAYTYLAENNIQQARDYLNLVANQPEAAEKVQISLAYTTLLEGDIGSAFAQYRTLFHKGIINQHVQEGLLNCSEHLLADNYLPNLENDLISFFEFDNIDYERLAPLATSLLCEKYRLFCKDGASADDIFDDRLLIDVLSHCDLKDKFLSGIVSTARSAIFSKSIQEKSIDDKYLPLIIGIGIQQTKSTQTSLQKSDADEKILTSVYQQLQTHFDEPDCTTSDVIGALLLTSMYGNLNNSLFKNHIKAFKLADWPLATQALMAQSF